jgi:hypothetical protein
MLTLLVKFWQCKFHCYQGTFHRGKVPIFLSFKDSMSKLFPTNVRLNQQSQRWRGLHGHHQCAIANDDH